MNTENIEFDLPKNKSNEIKMIGVGGGGNNAINYMSKQGIKGVDFIVCNTDYQALAHSNVPNKIQLGVKLTSGNGAGGDPKIGEQAAKENIDQLRSLLQEADTKVVFITAGMGGGTGTGAAPIIAKLAKDMGMLTIGVITSPFEFEGVSRTRQALIGIEKMRESVDSLLIINNEKLVEVYGNMSYKTSFDKADEVLLKASRSIAEVIATHYRINIDLKDARSVLENSGEAFMGAATYSGEDRAQKAVEQLLESPLLENNNIKGVKKVLLLIVSSDTKEVTINEIKQINNYIEEKAGNEIDVILGLGDDKGLDEAISITIIATGGGQQDTVQEEIITEIQEENIDIAEEVEIPTEIVHQEQIPEQQEAVIPQEIEPQPVQEVIEQPKIIAQEIPQTIVHQPEEHLPQNVITTTDTTEDAQEDLIFIEGKNDTDEFFEDTHNPFFQEITQEAPQEADSNEYLQYDNDFEEKTYIDHIDIEHSPKQEEVLNSEFQQEMNTNNDDYHIKLIEKEKVDEADIDYPNMNANNTPIDDFLSKRKHNTDEFSAKNQTKSSTSVTLDNNNEMQIRKNNSFLHDNVD